MRPGEDHIGHRLRRAEDYRNRLLCGPFSRRGAGGTQEKGIVIKKIIYVPSEAVGKVLARIPASGQNILDEEGMSFIVGGRQKRFYVMPDIAAEEYPSAIEEMDKKQIKYSAASGGPFGWFKRTAPASILPKTIFSDDQVLEIRTDLGG